MAGTNISDGNIVARVLDGKIPQGGVSTPVTTPRIILGLPTVRTSTDNDSLVSTDAFCKVVFNISSNKNCTINNGEFNEGDVVYVERQGAGTLSFVAGAGVTITTSLGALTDAGANNIMAVLFSASNACTIYNGVPSTSVPTSRTLAGLDLTTNRTASELNSALKAISAIQLVGSTNDRYHTGDLLIPGSLSTSTLTAGVLRAKRFPLLVTRTIDRIQAEVQTLGSSGVFRLGLWADNGSGYPGALVLDSGELSSNTTGVKNATVNVTLSPGLYWIGFLGGTATATFRSYATGLMFDCSVIGMDAAMGATQRQPFWTVSKAYGALPDPFTSGATINNTATNMPIIQVRYSA